MYTKIILLLSLAAFVTCGGGLSKITDSNSETNSGTTEKGYGANIPRQVKRNFRNFGYRGASWKIVTEGKIIGNPNISFKRSAGEFKLNGRPVPGVHPYNRIEIDWNPNGGIIVNGEEKPGFEDIKHRGRTIFLAIPYPVNIESSQGSKADKGKESSSDSSSKE